MNTYFGKIEDIEYMQGEEVLQHTEVSDADREAENADTGYIPDRLRPECLGCRILNRCFNAEGELEWLQRLVKEKEEEVTYYSDEYGKYRSKYKKLKKKIRKLSK